MVNFISFFLIWVFFHEHSRIAGLLGKGEGFSLIPHYHFHPLYRHLGISWAITAESSPPHIVARVEPVAAKVEPGTFGFRAQVANHSATRPRKMPISTYGNLLTITFLFAFVCRRLYTGCSTKGANYYSFDRVVSNIYLENVLLISFVSHLSICFFFVELLLIDYFEQCALQKERIIALFVEWSPPTTMSS